MIMIKQHLEKILRSVLEIKHVNSEVFSHTSKNNNKYLPILKIKLIIHMVHLIIVLRRVIFCTKIRVNVLIRMHHFMCNIYADTTMISSMKCTKKAH